MTGNPISGQRATRAAALLAAGAAAEYFLDPESGRRRRHLAHDRSLAMLRRRSREAVRRGKYLEGVAEGLAHRAAHTPKGHVSVNAERGVVYLRGQLDSAEQIEALVHATGAVEGVKGVKNLLHTK